jgi:anti-anti-sigma factor
MTDLFRVQAEQSVHVIEMKLPEQLDPSEFDNLNQSLLALLDGKTKGWVLDFSAVDYVGSAMLGLMVNFRQRVQSQKGRLVLCGVSSRLLEIIRTCCMDRLFPIAKTREQAVKLAK